MPRRRNPKRHNRYIPILDRTLDGMSGQVAAKKTVEAMIGQPVKETRKLRTAEDVVDALAANTPVVLTIPLPTEHLRALRQVTRQRVRRQAALTAQAPVVTMPAPDGHLVFNGGPMRLFTVTALVYNEKRQALRFTPSLGIGWGEMGRAWLSIDRLRELFADKGTHAWAPVRTPPAAPPAPDNPEQSQ